MRISPSLFLGYKDLKLSEKEEKWINPINGIITSSCGSRKNPILDKLEYHDGLDIAVKENTLALAVKSGTVIEVRNSKTLGKLIKYKTKDGYTVMYAHLNKVIAKEGDTIKQGDVVAKTGNTGLSTGPHLHYSVWKDEMLMNPMQFVSLPHTNEVKAEYGLID